MDAPLGFDLLDNVDKHDSFQLWAKTKHNDIYIFL